ncbi:MAG: hypothetical protein HFH41_12915 [Lachnospiraceae bacterium]|nr:hypothetical protein [Lachnospiraceae bacterium]
MYQTQDYYMYEILEDYQAAADSEQKEEIFSAFCSLIWNHPNQRKISQKTFAFQIEPALLDTDIGRVFASYSALSCPVCSSTTDQTDFASLIRQKVNNIYTNLFDDRICTRKVYLDLLRLPKKLYFQWKKSLITEPADWTMTAQELSLTLQRAVEESCRLKEIYGRQKMKLEWNEFCMVTEGFLRRLFHNYTPLDLYSSGRPSVIRADTWQEDNFCIRYFCSGLNGYFKNYQKKYYGLSNTGGKKKVPYSRCACGNLFQQNRQHNRRLCDACREKARLEKYRRYNQKRQNKTDTP